MSREEHTQAEPKSTPRPPWWNKRWSALSDEQKRQKVDGQRQGALARFTVAELWRYQDLSDVAGVAAGEREIAQRNLDDAVDYLADAQKLSDEAQGELTEYGSEIEAAATARAST